jgi:hypothetical protein
MKLNHLRPILLTVILIAGLALSACGRGANDSGGVALDAPFTLGVGDTIALTDVDLSITFDRVSEDSRCPTDVTCVQAGQAVVRLVIEPTDKSKETVDVTVKSLEGTVVGGFIIEALDLSPLPSLSNPVNTSQYVVELIVSAAP